MSKTWQLYDLSSGVGQTLDTSYQGLPYTDWIDLLVNAPTFLQPLANGNIQRLLKKLTVMQVV